MSEYKLKNVYRIWNFCFSVKCTFRETWGFFLRIILRLLLIFIPLAFMLQYFRIYVFYITISVEIIIAIFIWLFYVIHLSIDILIKKYYYFLVSVITLHTPLWQYCHSNINFKLLPEIINIYKLKILKYEILVKAILTPKTFNVMLQNRS